ncbi:hypothetical protein B0T11DRAFT_316141 [Plectosphaerella cucumerina]|uniref:Uncharacterized protein n=1 Tax=Plectosphaerella cucumerina TaxID=40658 RepID=A0A8K0X5Z1_9PEZI|nr:hypothetical protein B0T11DRAFT_316141 [Plectosphaerella cucumerina]
MGSCRILPQLILALAVAVPSHCDDTYSVAMVWPHGGQGYDSVVDGKVVFDDVYINQTQQDGRVPMIPCSSSAVNGSYRSRSIVLPVFHGWPFEVESRNPKIGTGARVLGDWSADVFFGRFESSDVDPDGNIYTWAPAMERKYRFVGDGGWCSPGHMSIPLDFRTVGDNGKSNRPSQIRGAALGGVHAVLAVRFNYFNTNLNPGDPGFDKPIRVTTEFRTSRFPIQRHCTTRDNGVDNKDEAAALPPPRDIFRPPAREINKMHVGIGVGAGFCTIILLYSFFRWAGGRNKLKPMKPSTSPDVGRYESASIHASSTQRNTSLRAPSPVHIDQPARLVFTHHVVQPPPPTYESPPRYEDVVSQRPPPV